MKRTNWIDFSYWHYYPDGSSGGILCGLFMPPGTKLNQETNKDDALRKSTVLVLSSDIFRCFLRRMTTLKEFLHTIFESGKRQPDTGGEGCEMSIS